MIIESIVSVLIVSTVVYLYWKSVEKESNDSLDSLKTAEPVIEKEVDPANLNLVIEVGAVEATANVAEEKAVEKPKRARTTKGKFASDDKATEEVNEAWVGGKSPKQTKPKAETTEATAKKSRAKKPKMTVLK
jgi:hypothetical protein